MNDNFEQAIAVVLSHEGSKFTDLPNDSGGPTKFGLTIEDAKQFGIKTADADYIKGLTKEPAEEIYRQVFWNPMEMGGVDNATIATVLLDQAVLAGIPTVAYMVQKILGLKQDGVMGPLTIATLNKQDMAQFCFTFLRSMSHHYSDLCFKNSTQLEFLTGWEDRIFSLLSIVFF